MTSSETGPTVASARPARGLLQRFSSTTQVTTLAIVLIALCVVFSLTSPVFLTPGNLINVARQVSFLGVAAVGASMVLLIGGLDLSVGSMLALTGVATAKMIVEAHAPGPVGLLVGLLVATLAGVINGIVITRFKIPALITTLATLTIFRGISYSATNGLPVFGFPNEPFLGFPEGIFMLGKGYVLGIPVPVIIMIVAFILGYIFLYRTYFGRYIYAIGGNEEAARLSGIKVERIQLMVYAIAGFLAGIAGLIVLGRVSSGQPSVAVGFELDVVTAVVLGGISIAGGKGELTGVLLGVLITGVLSNGLILLNVSEYNQLVVRGLVLLFAVGLDRIRINAARR